MRKNLIQNPKLGRIFFTKYFYSFKIQYVNPITIKILDVKYTVESSMLPLTFEIIKMSSSTLSK